MKQLILFTISCGYFTARGGIFNVTPKNITITPKNMLMLYSLCYTCVTD